MKQLYFLHIPKTGGMFLNRNIIQNKQIKSFLKFNNNNFLEDFKQSNYISGQWGITPIEINPNIDIACLFRDPLKRSVSMFIQAHKGDRLIINKEYSKIKKVEDRLRYFLFHDEYFTNANNLQAKSILNPLNKKYFNLILNNFDEQCFIEIKNKNGWWLEDKDISLEMAKNQIDKFNIVGTTDNYNVFFKKIQKWYHDNYNIKIKDPELNLEGNVIYDNKKYNTNSLIDLLTEKEKNIVLDNNNIDLEIYKYAKSKSI